MAIVASPIPRVKPTDRNRRWPTPKKYADEYGIGFSTVYRWIRDGELRAVKVGTRLRIPPA